MKLLIASDIHGSVIAAEKLKEIFLNGSFNKLIILGDFLYHGPRNPIPFGYSPMEVAAVLNSIKENIIAVRGNCDAEVDQMVLDFPLCDTFKEILVDNKTFFLTHGHKITSLDRIEKCDVFLSGHTHIPLMEKNCDTVVLNPGSPTLPKGGSVESYMTYDGGIFKLFSLLNQEELMQLAL